MDVKEFNTIHEVNKRFGVETHNPLITVLDLSEVDPSNLKMTDPFRTNLYYISIVKESSVKVIYGRNIYDFQDDTMIFVAPKQILKIEFDDNNPLNVPQGYCIIFHSDLFKGERLATNIKNYHFFDYRVSEALHLSAEELSVVRGCYGRIQQEIVHAIDKHSNNLIISNLELLLGYCQRFYDRQFITRKIINRDVLSQFEVILNEYFTTGMQAKYGLPTVKYCAQHLSLSPKYLGDLIKRETGHSAQEHIQQSIIERSKMILTTTSLSINEIAYSLGFEYPNYFSRLFKKRVGVSPNEYRM